MLKVKTYIPIVFIFFMLPWWPGQAQTSAWKPVEGNITTPWASSVTPANAWREYPRPQMVRAEWQNLNGLWQYTITQKDKGDVMPKEFSQQILVPFPIESALSGVKKAFKPEEVLWYKRTVEIKKIKKSERMLLHFGAVDWHATVYVNGHEVGQHKGGYTAFTFDITDELHTGTNEVVVRVTDPTDTALFPIGKQTLRPRTAFYTASSGIWQTVWLESVPEVSMQELMITPDIDKNTVTISVISRGNAKGYSLEAVVATKGKSVVKKQGAVGDVLTISMPNVHLWSPGDPFLYDLTLRLTQKGKTVDEVRSYFGMRKMEVRHDAAGKPRLYLNHEEIYNLGVLDQGFWPDGLYAAPSDSAFIFDISSIKSMGFNTIRKHLKVEPARWYYHCDRLGMLVWQDMPCRYPRIENDTDESHRQFEAELQAMIRQRYNNPAIVMWVPFNEDWGIFDEQRIEALVRKTDATRLVNSNSGSKANKGQAAGDLSVVHHYCYPELPPAIAGKPQVLGEFGGVNVIYEDHEWVAGEKWGHGEMMPGTDFLYLYEDWTHRLKALKEQGLAASIFTQPYDVEREQCGLMTYDRKVFKIPIKNMHEINTRLLEKK